MKNGLAALKFLTLFNRFGWVELNPEQVGNGAIFFPLVGLVLGSLLVLLERILQPYLESEILGATLVATLAVLTGAIHLEGLRNTFDALPAKSGFTRTTERQSGVLGILAILFVVLLKVRSIEVTGEIRSLSLLLTPVFARWGLVIFLYGSTTITEGAARLIAQNVRAWHLVLTTVATLILAAFLLARMALWMGLCISLLALLLRSFLQRRNTAIDHDNFGALIELSETLSFILFTTL